MSERSNLEMEMDQMIFQVMIIFYVERQRQVRAKDVVIELNIHVRNPCFRDRWTHLKKLGYIVWSMKYDGFRLSKAGIHIASTLNKRVQVKNVWGNEQEHVMKESIIPPNFIYPDPYVVKPATEPQTFEELIGRNSTLRGYVNLQKKLFANTIRRIIVDANRFAHPEQMAEQEKLVEEIICDLDNHRDNLLSVMNKPAHASTNSENEATVRWIMDDAMYDLK